jgi:D-lactate dehydrogenase
VAGFAADHYGAVTAGVRAGLAAADALHGLVGTATMKRSLDGLRALSGGRIPKWSPTLARPVRFKPGPRSEPTAGGDRIVDFPSCAARNMGAQRGHEVAASLPVTAERLFAKAGYAVTYPERLDELCCGQPFESKGLAATADRKSAELEAALRAASDDGRVPIVFDTSPCAYRMKRYLAGRLAIQDSIEFIDAHVLPRVAVTPITGPVAVHPVCSVRKMGTVDRLLAIANRCSPEVVTIDAVLCCGFAGDKGFTRPELNEHALRHLKAGLPPQCKTGYSTSRTCEIGLAEQAGFAYESIIYLVDACASARPADKGGTA